MRIDALHTTADIVQNHGASCNPIPWPAPKLHPNAGAGWGANVSKEGAHVSLPLIFDLVKVPTTSMEKETSF